MLKCTIIEFVSGRGECLNFPPLSIWRAEPLLLYQGLGFNIANILTVSVLIFFRSSSSVLAENGDIFIAISYMQHPRLHTSVCYIKGLHFLHETFLSGTNNMNKYLFVLR